jgi:hypothetical protein
MSSGQNLTAFFSDWFYGQGYPSYHLSWDQQDHGLHINLKQTTSHPSVAFFAMPVPVYVQGEGQDSLLRLESLFPDQDFDFDLPFQVELVEIDPDLHLISAGNTIVKSLVSGADEKLDLGLSVSPNPVEGELHIEISNNNYLLDRIEFSKIDGTILQTYFPRTQTLTLDTSNWIPGFYLISVWSGQSVITRRIIKN